MSQVSEARLLANRQNALKSTGPKTQAGKRRSSINALKHGLFATSVLLPGEDELAFHHLRIGFIKTLNPRNAIELHLVERIITDAWRIERLRKVEFRMLEVRISEIQDEQMEQEKLEELPDPDPVWAAWEVYLEDPCHEQLSKLQQRLENSMQRGIRQLRALQKEELEEQSQLSEEIVEANEPNLEDNCGEEEELATDGAPMSTDETTEKEVEAEIESVVGAKGLASSCSGTA